MRGIKRKFSDEEKVSIINLYKNNSLATVARALSTGKKNILEVLNEFEVEIHSPEVEKELTHLARSNASKQAWNNYTDGEKQQIINKRVTKYNNKSDEEKQQIRKKISNRVHNTRSAWTQEQIDNHQANIRATKKEKYGDENYNNREKAAETCIDRFGEDNYWKTDEFQQKSKATRKEKYGNENFVNVEKAKQTKLEKYGDENYNNQEQIQLTTYERFGVYCIFQTTKCIENSHSKDALNKATETKRLNGTFNSSKPEEDYYKYLVMKYGEGDVVRQYCDERYPFRCDFYIKSLDQFIELNLFQTHNEHPYGFSSDDELILNGIKSKQAYYINSKGKKVKNQYYQFETIWAIKDPEKINYAIKNKLNYILIYPNDIYIWEKGNLIYG